VWVTDQVMVIGRLSLLARAMTGIVHEVTNAQPRRSGKDGDAARRKLLSRHTCFRLVVLYFTADGHVAR